MGGGAGRLGLAHWLCSGAVKLVSLYLHSFPACFGLQFLVMSVTVLWAL